MEALVRPHGTTGPQTCGVNQRSWLGACPQSQQMPVRPVPLLFRISAILIPLLFALVAWSYYFRGPPDNDAPRSIGTDGDPFAPLSLEGAFTTAGRVGFEDLTLSFHYPNFWDYGDLLFDGSDATLRIIRPGRVPVSATIELLVTRSPTALDAPKPILPPGTKLIEEKRRPRGTTKMIHAEFVSATPLADYQHGIILESTDATRYISLTATCHGPTGNRDVVDRQFDELRATFDAVLSSLKLGPRIAAP